MIDMRHLPALCIIFMAMLSPIPAAAETDGERCDSLAANPGDPDRSTEVEGVTIGQMDIEAAISACTAAIAAEPNVPRFHYQLGRAAFAKGAYDTAKQAFQIAVDGGSAIAVTAMGILYENGYGVPSDEAKAMEFYREAGDEIGLAAYNLGIIHRDGENAHRDAKASFDFFMKGAALGYTDSVNEIGYAYEKGLGVEKNLQRAMHWYRRGAALGNGHSMNNIGWAYENGLGVKVDYAMARSWYDKAAEAGNTTAVNNIGNLYEAGHGVAQDYAKAWEWYTRAAGDGNPLAMANLAYLTATGKGTAADADGAVGLLLKSFEEGDGESDAVNIDYVMQDDWTAPFYAALQKELFRQGVYSGQPTGEPDAATEAALIALSGRS